MAGFIATSKTIAAVVHQLYEAGGDIPFLCVLTPYLGTPLYTHEVIRVKIGNLLTFIVSTYK